MTCRKKLLWYLFSTINYLYVQEKRKKYLRSSHVEGKREIACFHVETATGGRQTRKMAGKSWSRGHFVVSRVRDAKSLYFLAVFGH